MKKNPPLRKKLIKKLDTLWSIAVRTRYPKCVVCGKEPTQAHHCITRKAQSMGVRWIVKNGVGLCYPCHIHKLHGQQGDKMFLDRYVAILNELIDAGEQEAIREIGHKINKMSVADLQQLVTDFENGEVK